MSFRSLALTLAAVAIGCISTVSAQQEKCQSIVLPNGTVLTCEVVNGQKVYVDPGTGISYPATSTGVGEFTIVNSSTNPCVAELKPNRIEVTSNNPDLGQITTKLDPTRGSSLSTIKSLVPGSEFPAEERINFFAETTLASNPGTVYRSINEIQLVGTVNSFNPHRDERFKLAAPADFEDIRNPGCVAFTLRSLEVTLTGRAPNGELGN
jgi:hypothetical protein